MSRKLLDGKNPTKPPDANKGGAPTLLTPELMENIVAPLRIGARVPTAAAFNNVSYDVMRNWVLKGRQDPDSIYGVLIKKVEKAIAEWEMRDISVIEKHAMGAPAEYEKEVVRNSNGDVVMVDGKPLMQVARDADGNPIIKSHAIRSDWKAAIERLRSRLPKYWGRDKIDLDVILTFDNSEREAKPLEALSFEQRVAAAAKKLEEDF